MPLSVCFLPLGEDTRAACVFTASWVPLDATDENVVVDRSCAIRADAHFPSSDGLHAGTALQPARYVFGPWLEHCCFAAHLRLIDPAGTLLRRAWVTNRPLLRCNLASRVDRLLKPETVSVCT